jgi:hypothetical protein
MFAAGRRRSQHLGYYAFRSGAEGGAADKTDVTRLPELTQAAD